MRLNKLAEELYVPENFARFHHYYADAEGTKEYTGITTVLGVIAKPALIQWAAKMAVEHVAKWIESCIVDGKLAEGAVASMLEDARTAHAKKRDNAADAGTDTHALVEEYVNNIINLNEGCVPLAHLSGDLADTFTPIMPFIQWAAKEGIRFIAAEKRLYSCTHWIAGTCDIIFEKDGKRYIGDIKTYKKIWDRVPLLQCAGYALMWQEMNREDFTRVLPKIDGYCVICLPKERTFDENSDVLWSFDTEGDTAAFLAALKLYRYLNTK